MPANNDPIYSKLSDLQANVALITTVAATPFDVAGTIGTDIFKVFTADATNGGFVERLRVKYVGSATSIATVLKIFITSRNPATGVTSAADTFLFDEIAIPATGVPAAGTPLPSFDVPMNITLPPGYSILVKTTVGQTAANGFQVTAIAGKY